MAQLIPLGPRLGPFNSLYNINRISKYTWTQWSLGTQQRPSPSRTPGPVCAVLYHLQTSWLAMLGTDRGARVAVASKETEPTHRQWPLVKSRPE